MKMFSENVDNFRVSASPDFSVSSLPAAVACFSGGCKPSWQEEGNLWVIGGLENDNRAKQFDPGLRKIVLDSKHFHIYTAHCTLKTLKHYTHTVHKYTRKWTLHSAYLMKTPYTLYTAQYSVDADPSFVKFHCSITFDTALTFHKKNPHLLESVIKIILISIRCWQGLEEDLSHSVIKIILISNRCCSAGKAWRRMT